MKTPKTTHPLPKGIKATDLSSPEWKVRVGNGPHVLEKVRVYTRASRLEDLQQFLDLRHQGAIKANTTRDRISSRRAQGTQERSAGNSMWRWDV